MREIKFRAWDEEERFMYYGVLPISDSHFLIADQYGHRVHEAAGQAVHVMQFTGLHDTDGKEIWEGDIVKDADEGTLHVIKYYAEEWDYPAFDLDPYIDVDSNGISYCLQDMGLEVIGNIYENPELLKEASNG